MTTKKVHYPSGLTITFFIGDYIYGFSTIIPSIQTEINKAGYQPAGLNFTTFFTCRQLQTLNSMGDAEDFY